jgi:hypothetical protein
MRFFAAILIVALALSATALGQPQRTDLKLETKLIRQGYCVSPGPTHNLRLELEIKYTNTGEKLLILYKGSIFISHVRVAHSQDDLDQKKYESNHSITWVTSGSGNVPDMGSIPNEHFTVLKPGKSFKAYGETRILTDSPLAEGNHLLQVIIPTWNGTEDYAKRLKSKWQSIGHLWLGNAISVPMSFTFSGQKPKKC